MNKSIIDHYMDGTEPKSDSDEPKKVYRGRTKNRRKHDTDEVRDLAWLVFMDGYNAAKRDPNWDDQLGDLKKIKALVKRLLKGGSDS